MNINERFKEIIHVLYRGNKRAFATEVGVAPTVVENIVGKRQGKPSFEVIEKVCALANVNTEWLITGKGEPFTRRPGEKDGEKEQAEEKAGNSSSGGIEDKLLAIIQEKDDVIREQAEEIGRLRERVLQLELGKGKDASAATTSGVADEVS